MVTLAMHRRRTWASAVTSVVDAIVIGAGNLIGKHAKIVPGLAGAALVAWGTAQVYSPAGWILGGVFLLAADRQIKIRPTRGGE